MSKVKVSYYGLILPEVSGNHEEEVPVSGEATIRDLLHLLVEKYGEGFKESLFTPDRQLQTAALIHLDGRDINELDGLDTRLRDKSKLSIMLIAYMVTGG